MNASLAINQWILPLALIAGGFLLGALFERIMLRKLEKIAAKSRWEGDEILISALRGVTVSWFLLAGIYAALLNLPMSPILLAHLQEILLVVVVLSVTIVAARIAVGFVSLYTEKRRDVFPSTSIFRNLTKALVFLIGSLIILQSLGVSIAPMLTALGVGGLAVALALQDTLSNLFAGLHIIAAQQVRPGDYVKLDTGEEGYLTDITWRNSTIRALPNNRIIVPNSKLASAIITNFFLPEKEMAVLVEVGVNYDSDLEKVERVTMEVGKETMKEVPGGVAEFEPFIRYHTFGDHSIDFTVILRAKEFVDQYVIKHEFVKGLHQRYREEGIEIPFPIRTVFLKGKDGNPPSGFEV
jgi:small-conductance mechanosensitive channel